jgi:hypothetical protein
VLGALDSISHQLGDRDENLQLEFLSTLISGFLYPKRNVFQVSRAASNK